MPRKSPTRPRTGRIPEGALDWIRQAFGALDARLVPRQNRKRGDDLSAVEYLQYEDPYIQKRRVKASLEAALEKM
jgi:hypothetical protein